MGAETACRGIGLPDIAEAIGAQLEWASSAAVQMAGRKAGGVGNRAEGPAMHSGGRKEARRDASLGGRDPGGEEGRDMGLARFF